MKALKVLTGLSFQPFCGCSTKERGISTMERSADVFVGKISNRFGSYIIKHETYCKTYCNKIWKVPPNHNKDIAICRIRLLGNRWVRSMKRFPGQFILLFHFKYYYRITLFYNSLICDMHVSETNASDILVTTKIKQICSQCNQ